MCIETFKAAVLQRWPLLFVKGPNDPDFECGPKKLYIAAEPYGDGRDCASDGCQLFDYYAEDPREQTYVFGVHKEIRELEKEHNVFIEWINTASVGVYPA